RDELSKHRVLLQARLAKGLPAVHGDRVQLQQVVLNLILNAIEAMAGGGDDAARELAIVTECEGSAALRVSVSDSGPGVAAEARALCFEPFYTPKADGIGIGLSICRSIIDGHGGRLWVDADQDRGSVLRFTLPAAAG